MPRNSQGQYQKPNADVVTQTVIAASEYNTTINDLVADANLDRPIAAGGTGASTASDARDNLGVAEKQSGTNDATAGRGLIVGAGGLLGNAPVSSDWNAETLTKFLRTNAASTTGAPSTSDIWTGLQIARGATAATQLGWSPSTDDMRVRFKTADAWGSWYKQWHSGNALGTVSQSSGVPTGALFQAGNPATNIYYERTAGGLMTVWFTGQGFHYATTAHLTTTVSFATLPSGFATIKYAVTGTPRPENEAAAQTTFTSTLVSSGLAPSQVDKSIVVGGKTTSGFTASVYAMPGFSFGVNDYLYFDLVITGRWFA